MPKKERRKINPKTKLNEKGRVRMVSDNPRRLPAPLTFRSPDGNTRLRMRRPGRVAYSDAIARRICERIMRGEKIKEICKDPRMPSYDVFVSWLAHPKLVDFREMYYYARRIQAELLVDEIIEIADDSKDDWKPRYNKDGDIIEYIPDKEAIQRSRVRIDTRKWLAAKLMPRIYGERLQTDHEVVGDLAELLKNAINKDKGLPDAPPEKVVIDAEDTT